MEAQMRFHLKRSCSRGGTAVLKDMFRFWRRSEGFKWVTYVPTRILERRNRRREQVQAMKIEVKSYWRHVTEALWRHLVTALAAARTWVVWAVISAATAAIAGARRIGAWLGPRLASQFEQFTARLAPAWHSLQRPPVALGLAIAGCGLALAGLFVGWHTKFEASVIGMILLGTLIAGVFGTPLIARRIGPPLAGWP